MTNYVQTNDFSAKDSLSIGDSNKKILGSEVDTELSNISTAIASKVDSLVTTSDITDSSVTTVKIADDAVDYTKLADGTVLQIVNVQDGDYATGTTAIPQDDTSPQITEGDEYMTLAITPKLTTSKLKIDVVFHCSVNANSATSIVALFQDSTANALACSRSFDSNSQAPQNISFTHYMTSGTTSATTFRVRAGFSTGVGTALYFNGQSGARFLGGALASSITITEIKA